MVLEKVKCVHAAAFIIGCVHTAEPTLLRCLRVISLQQLLKCSWVLLHAAGGQVRDAAGAIQHPVHRGAGGLPDHEPRQLGPGRAAGEDGARAEGHDQQLQPRRQAHPHHARRRHHGHRAAAHTVRCLFWLPCACPSPCCVHLQHVQGLSGGQCSMQPLHLDLRIEPHSTACGMACPE